MGSGEDEVKTWVDPARDIAGSVKQHENRAEADSDYPWI